MNIHEYQAKQLFEQYGIPCPKGAATSSKDEFESCIESLGEGLIVVKSQIHAGGRGKGTFTDGFQGGVKLAKTKAEALEFANRMINNTLVTIQTGPAGREVKTVYFTEGAEIEKEYYLAILMDRATSVPVVVASTEGGVEIEKVANETPEKIFKAFVDPTIGLQAHQARGIAFKLGFEGKQAGACAKLIFNLYKMFWENDADMVEVNPLISTPDGGVSALDAKVSFDSNALYRHKDIVAFRDLNEEDPKEVEASKFDLNYIALDGNIACLVNGAGLAMATMDIINHCGGEAANFLDVGGGATAEQVTAAFKIILSDPKVEGILVNIFGGIMQCDVIAQGVIEAAKAVSLDKPLVVRLEGTNVEKGRQLLADSGIEITSADSLADAAQKIVDIVAAN
ncbi:MAG: ADP-forming succinate--CoA ligase subunit beta [Opitutaceae bacterium]|nr:ADP-forming succinate--CoA ligase subunit beta [Opitutaceae bacterium]